MRLERTATWLLAGAVLALVACPNGGSTDHDALSVRGGEGRSGAGGNGGYVHVTSTGGPLTVRKDGALPALPGWSSAAPGLGDHPRTISADTALTVGATLLADDGAHQATGLWVQPGATLTLTPETEPGVSIAVPEGVLVDGAVVMAPLAGSLESSSLSISAKGLAVRGRIELKGRDSPAGADGGRGGMLVAALRDGFLVTGSLVATGGAGDSGGSGGVVSVTVAGPAWVPGVAPGTIAITGLVDTSGGEGRIGTGGRAGWTAVNGDWGVGGACDFFNSGTVRARGGNGAGGGGGAQRIDVSGCSVGAVVNTGTFDASGGSATKDGPGGSSALPKGSTIALLAGDGVLYLGGRLLAAGGAGAGTGSGGDGGRMSIHVSMTETAASPSLGVHVAARLDASGGPGTAGGRGGRIEIADDGAPTDAGITFFATTLLDCRGGCGTTAGGVGGGCQLSAVERYDPSRNGNVLGPVLNQAAVDASGGDASAGAGGAGGFVWVGTEVFDRSYTLLDPDTVQTVSDGAIRARGGKGTTSGGEGGSEAREAGVLVHDEVALFSRGPVDVSGGAGGTGAGGAGGYVRLYGSGAVTATGQVVASGGSSSSADGGSGGLVDADALATSLGAVTADGGASPGGTGGDGGAVSLTSDMVASKLIGTISVRGGSGGTAGGVGTFTMDGTSMTLTGGRFSPP